MKATFVELRKKSGDIVRALDRNERVTVFYRGRAKAILQPIAAETPHDGQAAQHPAFGLWQDRDDNNDATKQVRALRANRFDAL